MPAASAPLVSVVMPVYNSAPYVAEAVASILNQTFTDFELLIFNDGSTDGSGMLLRGFTDARIRLFDYADNVGYVAHLNHALELARGPYLARMDADDVADPDRLARQVALLEAHPEIGLCGTAYREFGSRQGLVPVPETDAEIRRWLLRSSPFGHPTVLLRTDIVRQHRLRYDAAAMPAEDYRLWYELSRVTQLANLPEPLLAYRVHPTQTSQVLTAKRLASVNETRRRQLLDKGFELTPAEWEGYLRILDRATRPRTAHDLQLLLATMRTVASQNARLQAYPAAWFEELFAAAWQEAVIAIERHGWAYARPVLLAPKPFPDPLGPMARLKLLAKCAVGWRVPSPSPSAPAA
ncbi:glycosyltransferase family 2 protein [Hymenobacter armeniacus]|uniref:Glycosyltransferase family 2 protein n=1 Tax=Hymenobacter armeniacus TaxID=2771358 RepID=A0ABR8JXI1_9BACT|nr:glycosyltransferase family A protein [Hymenobacter armeniacus]MBD2724669.1 glycosyltransferase family 2 protein [Hymenobacter armeniacus]